MGLISDKNEYKIIQALTKNNEPDAFGFYRVPHPAQAVSELFPKASQGEISEILGDMGRKGIITDYTLDYCQFKVNHNWVESFKSIKKGKHSGRTKYVVGIIIALAGLIATYIGIFKK